MSQDHSDIETPSELSTRTTEYNDSGEPSELSTKATEYDNSGEPIIPEQPPAQ